MRRIAYAMLAPMVLSLVLAFTPTASANHLWATSLGYPDFLAIDPEHRIDILAAALAGETELSYPESTGFFVYSGWVFLWKGGLWEGPAPPEFRRAYASDATTFELWIDGELQKSSRLAPLLTSKTSDFPQGDEHWKAKFFVIENHGGLSGPHEFVGRWFVDASVPAIGGELGDRVLVLEWTLTVHFG